MLYVKAFHLIGVVSWFAGLFYLPRLFVYHTESRDTESIQRFKLMERRLYYGIMWPAGLFTTLLGLVLISFNPHYYLKVGWMHAKLLLVAILWAYHLGCGHYLKAFAQNKCGKSALFFRIYNEMPTLILIAVVILAVVKPF